MGLGIGASLSSGKFTKEPQYARRFNGVDTGITVASEVLSLAANAIRADTTEFSFSVWVKQDAISSSNNIFKIRNTENTENQAIFQYHASGNNFRFACKFGNANRVCQSATENSAGASWENDGIWHHFVGIVSQTLDKYQLWVDGTLADEIENVLDLDDVVNAFSIGNSGAESAYFKGDMDDLCMWNRAISSDEIGQLLAARKNANDKRVDILQDANLSNGAFLYHKFNNQNTSQCINEFGEDGEYVNTPQVIIYTD